MAILDELIIKLGLEEDSSNESVAKSFGDKAAGIVTAVSESAKKAGTLILGAVTGFAAFGHFVGVATAETAKFAKDINASFEGLQELRFAAEMSGRSVSDLDADLKKISDAQKAPFGAAMGYRMLGVSLKDAEGKAKDVTEVMIDLSGRLQGMSTQRTKLIQDQLGFSDDTLKVLKQGPEALRALAKEGRDMGAILPESAAETAIKYNETITRLKKSFEALSFRIGSTFLPVLKEGVEWFQKIFTASQRWINSRIQEFTKGVSDAFSRVKEIISAVAERLSPLTSKFDDLTDGLDMVAVFSNAIVAALAIAAMAFAPAIASALAMAAAITAVGLVVDDLINYFEGGESVIGAAIESIKEKFPALYDTLAKIADFAKETFGKVAPAVIEAFGAAFDAVVSAVQLLFVGVDKLFSLMSSSDVSWVSKYVDVFVSLLNLAKELLTAVADIFNAWASGEDVNWSAIGDRLWESLKDVLVKFGELMVSLAAGLGKAIRDGLNAVFSWAEKKIKGWLGIAEDTPEEKTEKERKSKEPGAGFEGYEMQSGTSPLGREEAPEKPRATRRETVGDEPAGKESSPQRREEPQIRDTPQRREESQQQPKREALLRAINQAPTAMTTTAEIFHEVQASRQPQVAPLPATATQKAGATVTDNSKREQTNNFNINATDPMGTATAVKDQLGGQDSFLQQKFPGFQRGTY